MAGDGHGMSGPQHKWDVVLDAKFRPYVIMYWSQQEYLYRCERCGLTVQCKYKPTVNFLKKRNIGRTCAESLVISIHKE